MATYKCNDGVYTVLRNGKVITMSGIASAAIAAIAADAVNVVCPPECCITDVPITIDSFDVVITTTEFTGLSVRATITHALDIYSTAWVAAAATNTIDLTGLIVEFGSFETGDTICIDYTYDQITVIDGCCLTVLTETVLEDDTYQLSDIVRECDGGTFDLVFQNPDGGVTVDADGEMVVPDIEADETVYVTYTCDGCVTELLVLEATNVIPPEGLRMLFDDIANAPVVDPTIVGQWNTFFDLPTNGAVFTSVVVAGNQVTLVGGGAMTIKNSLLSGQSYLVEIEDQSSIVIEIEDYAFQSAFAITLVGLQDLATAGEEGFNGCSLVTTFDFPLLTTLGENFFTNCTSATLINLPICVNLANNPASITAFQFIIGNTITLNIAAVNATNNAGGVHASVAYLIANNTATVNYI